MAPLYKGFSIRVLLLVVLFLSSILPKPSYGFPFSFWKQSVPAATPSPSPTPDPTPPASGGPEK